MQDDHCKRMEVWAIGKDKEGNIECCRNYNKDNNCTKEIGNCGCTHAEIALLNKMKHPVLVVLSHSPCLDCAKALIEAGVQTVLYLKSYRNRDGIKELLVNNIITCELHQLGYSVPVVLSCKDKNVLGMWNKQYLDIPEE